MRVKCGPSLSRPSGSVTVANSSSDTWECARGEAENRKLFKTECRSQGAVMRGRRLRQAGAGG
eukprot:2431336-Pleurochrysis_carterae.AAC.1